MRIIYKTPENGFYNWQEWEDDIIPEGWGLITDEMIPELPVTFPYGVAEFDDTDHLVHFEPVDMEAQLSDIENLYALVSDIMFDFDVEVFEMEENYE